MKNNKTPYREAQHLTQDELAELTGVSRQTIISLEKFKYSASLQLARKLSLVFKTTIEELFILDDGGGG